MNIKEIKGLKELIKLMSDSDLTEIAIEQGEETLTLKRDRTESQVVTQTVVAQAAAPVAAAAPAVAAAPAATEEAPAADGHIVTAPLVGTYYGAPAPDADNFVQVGDKVKKGDTLCIIEAMKLMNEIESDVSGTIVEIIVENATAVEFGGPLMRIMPG